MRRIHYGWVMVAVGLVTLVTAAGFRSTTGILIVGETASISAKISAGTIVSRGRITGDIVAKQRIAVDDMYTLEPTGRYWYKNGWNPNAVITVAATGLVAILLSLFTSVGDFGWFIGCGLGFAVFVLLAYRTYRASRRARAAIEEAGMR